MPVEMKTLTKYLPKSRRLLKGPELPTRLPVVKNTLLPFVKSILLFSWLLGDSDGKPVTVGQCFPVLTIEQLGKAQLCLLVPEGLARGS
jgi:hypothetical protein